MIIIADKSEFNEVLNKLINITTGNDLKKIIVSLIKNAVMLFVIRKDDK
ncbi:hypothetical protein [[Mycoplasma] imitans]|nr:hypothetical protein [[Mycoplasma] imitans]